MGGICSRVDEDDDVEEEKHNDHYQQQQQRHADDHHQQQQQQRRQQRRNKKSFHAAPTIVADMPPPSSYSPPSSPPVATTTAKNRKNNNRYAASSLFRVGSIIPSHGPSSPAQRASDYNHVHEMVAINFELAESERREKNSRWKSRRFQMKRKKKTNNNKRKSTTRGKPSNKNAMNGHDQHHDDHDHHHVGATGNVDSFAESSLASGGGGVNSSLPPLGVVGLRNMGNTCYLNSSLQCLSATIPLTDYFLAYNFKSEINKENVLGTGGKLATAYAELMKIMWLGNHSSSSTSYYNNAIQPSAFKQQLDKFSPQFVGSAQQDSQELIAFLLDGIHEDLNRIKPKKPYIEDSDCDGTHDEHDAILAWRNYLRRDKSVIVDIFQGQLKNSLTCLQCGHSNIRFEPFMYLSLPLTDKCNLTLQDCLDEYCRVEYLQDENQWYCKRCKRHVDAKKKTDLWILPPILIVHLKRFRFNDSGHAASKNEARVAYPIRHWDLERCVKSRAQRTCANLSYDLYAVSNHVGGRLGSGHYTAYCLNRFDDEWYQFNDSSATRVDEATLQQHQSAAYVLFYNRSDTTNSNTNNNGQHGSSSQEDGNLTSNVSDRPAPLIRRQSVSRPDLWPHTQVQDHQFRNFRRSSMIGRDRDKYGDVRSVNSSLITPDSTGSL
jgi:ubiquitin carboxyl-terminal hydrolase 8